MSSNHKIWSNHYWNRLECTQEMFSNTDHHIRTHLDQKIEFDEKIFSKFIFLTNFLKDFFKALFRSQFWAQILSKMIFFKELISISKNVKSSWLLLMKIWQVEEILNDKMMKSSTADLKRKMCSCSSWPEAF